jgi:predicted permease
VMMARQLGLTGGLPGARAGDMLSDRSAAVLFPHGYLRQGETLGAATAQLDAAWAALAGERALDEATQRLVAVPFRRSPTGGQAVVLPFLAVLTVMGLLVLLIACANIAGLVLVRGVSRRGEVAVRLALGASRARVVRLLALENLVLAVPGAALGLALSAQTIPQLLAYADWLAAPQRLYLNVQVDWLVIGFTAVIALACAVVFGLAPALQSSRVDLVAVINEDASPRTAGPGRLRAGLVVAQVAVSLLLLVSAGLASRSVDAARRADPGFDVAGVATAEIELAQHGYDDAGGQRFYRALLEEVRRLPGVESATLAEVHPLAFLPTRSRPVVIEGHQARRGEDVALLGNAVGSDYFRTLRIPLAAGRPFDDHDDPGGAPVAMVNRTFADRYFGGADAALGRRLKVGDDEWRTIVGVAADVKYLRLDEGPTPYVYLPVLQAYRSRLVLHARGAGLAEEMVEPLRARITALDPDLPILSARPLAELTRGATLFLEFAAMVLFVFGAAGLALSAIGTYGQVAYAVRQATHEIGIRMALGASRRSVVRGFLVRGLRLGVAGAALGLLAALAVTGLLRTVLFGVSPTDPAAFAQGLGVVLGAVALATLVPAWRASRTDPLQALRHQ